MSLKVWAKRLQSAVRDPRQFAVPQMPRLCPICGYKGMFLPLGTPSRWNGRCPNCGSRERDRLIRLFLAERAIDMKDGRSILHFAPEGYFKRWMADAPNYHTADVVEGKARHAVDISQITFPDASFDVVIANHVLEHVMDDQKAMREMYRVLKPGGFALITVPQNWAREDTYENADANKSEATRYAHYFDTAHVRYYGRDFPQRLAAAGFGVECWRMPQAEEPLYGLGREDVIWLGWKFAQQ